MGKLLDHPPPPWFWWAVIILFAVLFGIEIWLFRKAGYPAPDISMALLKAVRSP